MEDTEQTSVTYTPTELERFRRFVHLQGFVTGMAVALLFAWMVSRGCV